MEIQYNGRVPWMSVVIQASRAQWLNSYPVCQTSVNVIDRLYTSLCETFPDPLTDDATAGLLYCGIVSSPVQSNLTWHHP